MTCGGAGSSTTTAADPSSQTGSIADLRSTGAILGRSGSQNQVRHRLIAETDAALRNPINKTLPKATTRRTPDPRMVTGMLWTSQPKVSNGRAGFDTSPHQPTPAHTSPNRTQMLFKTVVRTLRVLDVQQELRASLTVELHHRWISKR